MGGERAVEKVLRKRAGEFFRPFGLTDVQFNLMMLLAYQSGDAEGLNAAEIRSALSKAGMISKVILRSRKKPRRKTESK